MSIDKFSYHLGAADCFCEMVRAGVKRIALSHPCDSREERDSFLPEFDKLCEKYGVHYFVENAASLRLMSILYISLLDYNSFSKEERYAPRINFAPHLIPA